MRRFFAAATAVSVLALAPVTGAMAQNQSSAQNAQDDMMARIPYCPQPLGTLSIVNGNDARGWNQNNLEPPERLLRVIVQRSNCFNLVDRGAGLNAASRERDIGGNLGLQRGSNVGLGQVRAADYVLVAEVGAQDSNTGGGAVAGAIGGLVGGRFGALASGIQTSRMEANTILSLTSVRTTETIAVTEGYATRNNVNFGGGAFLGAGGAIGGGYDSTEIGRIVTQAFIDAYIEMIPQLQAYQAYTGGQQAAQIAPTQTYQVVRPINMYAGPDNTSAQIRVLDPGMQVYPTGAQEGLWWQIADPNDNVGWVLNTGLQPAQ